MSPIPDNSSESYIYDAVGNRLTATTTSGAASETTSYQYDSRNRLVLETKPSGATLAYSYNAAGNRTGLTSTVPTNTGPITLIESHTFDVLNRLESSTDSGNNITVYAYDDVGNRAAISHPNGNTTLYSYDSLNRLIDISVFNAANVLVDQFTYTLGDSGRREVISELSGRVSTYVYDDLYRLTSESIVDSVAGNHVATYVYDVVGNRASANVNGVTTAYSYDDNDRLGSAGGDSYSYDANGNTVSKTEGGVTTSFGYDKRNRLVSSTTGGVTTSYSYDVDGIRTQRSSSGETTDFVVDHNRDYAQVVAEVTDGDFAVGYSFGDDLISQVFPGGSVYFYHYDGLGSTRSLSDNTGLFTDEYDYEAFGELTNSTGGTENSYLFTGEQYDAGLGDYYLRARYYDQGIGRFTQMDTFQGLQNDPVTLHKYLYGNVNPVSVVDPSGNFGIGSFGAALSTRAVLTAVAYSVPFAAFDAINTFREGGSLGAAARSGVSTLATGTVLGGLGGAVIANIGRYSPSLIHVTSRSISNIIGRRAASSPWALGPFARGLKIESLILNRAAQIKGRLVPGFQAIDDFTGGVATSIKSLDLTAATYRSNPNAVASAMRKYAETLSRFNGASRSGVTVLPNEIKDRVLLVAFEFGSVTPAQSRAITEFLRNAKNAYPNIKIATQWIP